MGRRSRTFGHRTRPRWIAPTLILAVLAVGLSALNTIDPVRHVRMLAPALFGMERAAPGLYLESGQTGDAIEEIETMAAEARGRVAAVFGGVVSSPRLVVCRTQACFSGFGGNRQAALSFGRWAILLGPRGVNAPILAHEWAHAELAERLAANGADEHAVPRWFDEGLAVLVSAEPRHSAEISAEIDRRGLPRPGPEALMTHAQWNEAVMTYGDAAAADGAPDSLYVTYATAGDLVRGWHHAAGRAGLRALIDAVGAGRPFVEEFCRSAPTPSPACPP